ncbi:MAG: Lrp/AsnC family transcriptional regulator [Serpentinimonas sp.]|jgi:DNA-binding Lrp family transcriptional regulator|nr:Lrp/AsnC family transcriptional regulator [Serpentinimonas sp.]
MNLDRTDLKLLALLQQDASASNQELAEQAAVSPATSSRRVRQMREAGLIERTVAILSPDRVAQELGHGITALVEVTLERQAAEHLQAFEALVTADPSVQQCYRVSPGPDFILVMACLHMEQFHTTSQRLFTQTANVRNVRTFFSVHRSKFLPALPLPAAAALT